MVPPILALISSRASTTSGAGASVATSTSMLNLCRSPPSRIWHAVPPLKTNLSPVEPIWATYSKQCTARSSSIGSMPPLESASMLPFSKDARCPSRGFPSSSGYTGHPSNSEWSSARRCRLVAYRLRTLRSMAPLSRDATSPSTMSPGGMGNPFLLARK